MGNHSEKRKLKTKLAIFVICIIIVILIIIGILITKIKQNTSGNKNNNYVEIGKENNSLINYYDNDKASRVQITEGKIINKNIIVCNNKGKAKISKNNGEFEDYNLEELSNGKYTIKLVEEDETIASVNFEIDTLPPELIGLEEEIYYEDVKVQLKDINDAKVAQIIKMDGSVINLKEHISKQDEYYTLTENGRYDIYVEDHNGNSDTITIFIVKEKER